jgi:hypothetical protein
MEKPKKQLLGVDFADAEKRIFAQLANAKLKGMFIRTRVHDEFKAMPDEFGIDVAGNKLSIEEWRWAVVLRRVYKVTPAYFEEQKPPKRTEIIKQLTALAEKDNRAGRKAAEAVGIVVEMAIERREPKVPVLFDMEANAQLDAYRYLFAAQTPDELKKGGSK